MKFTLVTYEFSDLGILFLFTMGIRFGVLGVISAIFAHTLRENVLAYYKYKDMERINPYLA